LDEIIGGKEEFRDMMISSGIIEKENNSRQVQIVTGGEGLLPILQKKKIQYKSPYRNILCSSSLIR
jgi:exosome complex RNA-binding protein Rrp42 (RNase PH superfamily)